MAEVSEKVREDFRLSLAREKAKSAAEAYLDELKGGKEWDSFAKAQGKSPETTDFFTRNDFISQIGYSPELQEESFFLSQSRRYPDKVFQNESGIFVIRWEGEEGIDEKEFQEQKDKYRQTLMVGKFQQVFQKWLENLRKKADIEILSPLVKES